MPEPEIEIIKNICIPYSQNLKGIGLVFHADPSGNYKTWKIDLLQKEIGLVDHHLTWNAWIAGINSCINSANQIINIMPFQPSSLEPSYDVKTLSILKDNNIVYIENKESYWKKIIDDERSIYYEVDDAWCIFDASKNTGLDIVYGQASIAFKNLHDDVRIALYNNKGIVWRRNEFPYESMTILMSKDNPSQSQFLHRIGRCYLDSDYYESVVYQKKFKGLLLDTFALPTFTYHTDQIIAKQDAPYLLSNYVTINFNHRCDYYPEDQKQILVIHYDSYKSDKAVKFFDPGSLTYNEGHEVYLDAGSKPVKFDPGFVTPGTKITIYAWNGQSPFSGKAELVVK